MVNLTVLQQKKTSLEQRLAAAETALKSAQRKDDSRRKIILGGAVLAALRAGEIDGSLIQKILAQHVADRDRRLFDGSSLAINRGTQS